jgi:hypothetical protein
MSDSANLAHRQYLEALRRLGPEGRLRKALELSEMTRALFWAGLCRRFPNLSEAERKAIYLERLAKCHNRNY